VVHHCGAGLCCHAVGLHCIVSGISVIYLNSPTMGSAFYGPIDPNLSRLLSLEINDNPSIEIAHFCVRKIVFLEKCISLLFWVSWCHVLVLG
jgi:hypothetical protein